MARPKAFDRDQALHTAMELFWARGYEAVSMTDLRKAMGIGRQSLYDTFGDKDALFAEVLGLYNGMGEQMLAQVLDHGDGVEAVRRFFEANVEMFTRPGGFRGCLVVNSCVERGQVDPATAQGLRQSICFGEERVEAALRRAQQAGTLGREADPRQLAALLMTVMHGLAVRARSGAPAEEIRSTAQAALRLLD